MYKKLKLYARLTKKISLILYILLLPFLSNCEQAVNVIFSDRDDVKIGRSMDLQFRKQSKFKILYNQPLRNYVQKITGEILKSPHVRKKHIYPYRVTLIDDDQTINAFCTPGGFIYVYTGLMQVLPNEAALAAVLAHEIAHAEKRHARQRMLSAMSIQIIMSLILEESSSVLVDLGTRVAGNLALLHNSRGDELEADRMAFHYLQNSIYYPGAMSYFFSEVQKTRKRRGKISKAIEGLLSTHPIPEKRLTENHQRIQKAKIPAAKATNLFRRRYQRMLYRYGIKKRQPFKIRH